jgi:outer membrane protein assembly factor BamE
VFDTLPPMRIPFMKLPLLIVVPLLAACSSTSGITSYMSPYRVDVRQGNYVSQEMVAQLKPGQTRDQVRFILGSPLVTDIFHADRWDYVYRFKPGRGEAQERRLTVFFVDNKLSRVAGDVVANEAKTGATGADAARPTARVIEIERPVEEPTITRVIRDMIDEKTQ